MKRDPPPTPPRSKTMGRSWRTVNPGLTCASPHGEGTNAKLPPGFACPDCTKVILHRFVSNGRSTLATVAGIHCPGVTGHSCHTSPAPLLVAVGSWSRRCPGKCFWPKTLQAPSLRQPQKRSRAGFQPLALQTCQQRPDMKNFSARAASLTLAALCGALRSSLSPQDPECSSDPRVAGQELLEVNNGNKSLWISGCP